MEVSMKVHLIRIAVLVLAIVSPLLATPVAARPKDPDSFQVTPPPRGGCNLRTSFGDPPLNRRCPAGSAQLAVAQTVSQRPAEAQQPLRTAVSTVTRAGAPQYPLEMRTTTNVSGSSWTAGAILKGDHATPDALRGALTIANP
jgi:hypothetical protein